MLLSRGNLIANNEFILSVIESLEILVPANDRPSASLHSAFEKLRAGVRCALCESTFTGMEVFVRIDIIMRGLFQNSKFQNSKFQMLMPKRLSDANRACTQLFDANFHRISLFSQLRATFVQVQKSMILYATISGSSYI